MPNASPASDDRALEKLQEIILSPVASRLDDLDAKVSKAINAEMVAEILPMAVDLSHLKGVELQKSFQPLVESVIQQSIEKDRSKMIEILFPIIGETIKRSVFETFKAWAQSIELIIERSFTIEGLKWRLEARRTGVSVGEIALKHLLIYRVEHVFLIDKATAKTLCHVSHPQGITTDTSVFGGMVDAISGFVRDVFITHEKTNLSMIAFNNHTIWFTEAENLLLVSIIRGQPSPDLKIEFQSTLDQIQFEKRKILSLQTDNPLSFNDCQGHLESLLEEQKKDVASETPTKKYVIPVLTGLIIIPLLVFSVQGIQKYIQNQRFDQLLTEIRKESQFFLVDQSRVDGKLALTILLPRGSGVNSEAVQDKINKMTEDLHLDSSSVVLKQIDLANYEQIRRAEEGQDFKKKIAGLGDVIVSENLKFSTENSEPLLKVIEDNYFLAKKVNQSFIVVIEYPRANLKLQADSFSGYLRFMLDQKGVYDFHLIRTRYNPKHSEYVVQLEAEGPHGDLDKK